MNDMEEIIEVRQAEMLEAINRAEVDIQISTAKQYPRDVNRSLDLIETYATMDRETAEECFYVLRRGGTVIEGLSVRMAEIIASSWGNLRVQSRIIGNDGRMITAQAICHDLETNYAVSKEVKRRITDKNGRTYSDDMQVTTGNAAASIAYRNAVLAVIPKAITKKVIARVKEVALGQALELEVSRQNMIAYFQKLGVTEEQIFTYLDVRKADEITADMVFELRGVANAIREGTTTIKESFLDVVKDTKAQEQATKQAETAQEKAEQAMAMATGSVLIPQAQKEDKAEETKETKEAKEAEKPEELGDATPKEEVKTEEKYNSKKAKK